MANELTYSPMWIVALARYKCGKCERGVIEIGKAGKVRCRVCRAQNVQPQPLTVAARLASAGG